MEKNNIKSEFALLKREWKSVVIGALITLGIGFASSLLSGSFDEYSELIMPPFSPPSWVFPVVWTVLYILIGEAAGLSFKSMCESRDKDKATLLFATQMLFNFVWSPLFFGLDNYLAALVALVIMILTTLGVIKYFDKCVKISGFAMKIYLLWLLYALYLNIGVIVLN